MTSRRCTASWTSVGYDRKRPVILAESGAVEPRHTGPFEYHKKDTAGMLLHDVLFATFFGGPGPDLALGFVRVAQQLP